MTIKTHFQTFADQYLPSIETQIKKSIDSYAKSEYDPLYGMLRYHMGWEGDGAGLKAQGKRIRPLLLLITATALNADWQTKLPFAAAVELIHNFSLIHDDIEDNSELRRGRKTAWVKWGIPQTINAGDLLFTIAHLSILEVNQNLTDSLVIKAARLLHHTCILLTQGQYMDMAFESTEDILLDDYWKMISGKTAALIGCCTELGAIDADPDTQQKFSAFGREIGLAFQIQDDLLGLWGETSITGKSSDSDLVSRKKTFPILYALKNNQDFQKMWNQGNITTEDARDIAQLLIDDGTYEYTRKYVKELTTNALNHLESTGIKNNAIQALYEFANQMLVRNQ